MNHKEVANALTNKLLEYGLPIRSAGDLAMAAARADVENPGEEELLSEAELEEAAREERLAEAELAELVGVHPERLPHELGENTAELQEAAWLGGGATPQEFEEMLAGDA